MFAFLSRTGRLFVGIPIIIAVAAIMGFNVLNAVPTASKHKDPGACSVAMGAVVSGQQRLLVKAWALSPSAGYLEAQTGVQSVMVTTDSTGAVSDQSLLFHGSGNYSISFDYYYWSNNKLVQATATSCSAAL